MGSPFQRHFGTNYVPSIEEVSKIKDILEFSSKEILQIDLEIDQLQRQLHLQQEKRSKVHSLAEQHRTLISPARRLDRDIIEEIFLACLPTHRNPCMSAIEAPMLLTRICGSWRSIALSTPQLWTGIHIVLPVITLRRYFEPRQYDLDFLQLKLNQRQAAAKEWLDRSGTCPLSISVYECPDSLSSFHAEGSNALEARRLYGIFIDNIVVPYHQRWKNLDVFLSIDILVGNLLKNGLTAECLPMLEELHITRQSIRHPPRKLEWLDIVSLISSRIYSATFFGVIFRPSDFSSTPEHVWEHLTELNLELSPSPMDSDEIDMADFASAVIRHCRLLKSLKLRVSTILSANDSSPQWRHDTKNILLEHLTVLSLSLPLTREVVGFVKCLCLPSIRNLDFHVTSNYHNQTFEMANNVLRALLHICGDNLQSLGLYSPSYLTSSKNMVQLLQLTPHLKSLYVCSSSLPHNRWVSPSCDISAVKDIINDELLHALSPLGNDYSDIICPQLEALECDYRSIRTGITENGLKEFAKARKLSHLNDQRVASLRRLCVPIDDLKQQVEPNTEKVSLGSDSCIYFQKPQEYSLSPWEGLIEWREPTSGSHIPQEIYNEL